MADFNRPPPKKHAINEKKLQLHQLNESGKSATLKFNVNKNYPRIDVYTNDDNDPKKSEPIRAAMDQPSFYMFLQLLEAAANSKEAMEHTIENKGHTFFGGKRSEKAEVISRLTVGKNDSGVVWISVIAKNRPKIKFQVLPSNWNDLVDVTSGQKIGPGIASRLCALAWKNMLSQLVGTYLVFGYEEEEAKPPQQGGGNNRWQGGGGNQQPAQSKSSGSDDGDDFPF